MRGNGAGEEPENSHIRCRIDERLLVIQYFLYTLQTHLQNNPGPKAP